MLLLFSVLWLPACSGQQDLELRFAGTVAGTSGELGEPFGVAVRDGAIYISDGEAGKIWRIVGGSVSLFAEGLDTPSAIAFNRAGDLLVADTGANTIRSIDVNGVAATVAGVPNRSGFADGEASASLFNGPIGIAVDEEGRIYVTDTYNDRVRVIENGRVSTIAGSSGRGYADGSGDVAKFDTPCGIGIWNDSLVVADSGNRRIRVVERDGRAWTLAGDGGEGDLKDGLLSVARFVQPTAVAADVNGIIFVTDGNAIRRIGGRAFPTVETISDERRGLMDGDARHSRFNRPSGLALGADGDLLVADSENRVVRQFSRERLVTQITAEQITALGETPETFRTKQPPRWPYDPPDAPRDVAGTLGELRGEVGGKDQLRFHNGLDIAGAYGETARFIRDEKVLSPFSADNFGTTRELLRMPTIGYIHIRLGRGAEGNPYPDARFQFSRDGSGKLTDIRVPRGARFTAEEPIGTLNSMNHVHLIAGRSGSEMNALDALVFPGLVDTRPPVIEDLTLFSENWSPIATVTKVPQPQLNGKTRIVVRAFDQVDGNSDRRRLGVYKLGYTLLKPDGSPALDTKWTILFDRLGPPAAVPLVYANGSKSGATGETIFNYIVSNYVHGDEFREEFLDPTALANGMYTLRVFAADYFGNTTFRDVVVEIRS